MVNIVCILRGICVWIKIIEVSVHTSFTQVTTHLDYFNVSKLLYILAYFLLTNKHFVKTCAVEKNSNAALPLGSSEQRELSHFSNG